MSNEKLQELLGNNYIPEQLETIPIDAVIAELAPTLIARSRSFANVAWVDIQQWLNAAPENESKLREALRPLTDDVDVALKQALVATGVACTPREIVYLQTYQPEGLDVSFVWLELGNRNAGLIHMLAYGNGTGHADDYTRKFINLTSLHDLFSVVDTLLHQKAEYQERINPATKKKEGSWLFTITTPLITERNIIIQPAQYLLPVGTNGFMVSLYPTGEL